MKENISEAISALTESPIKNTAAERFLILDELKSQHKDLPQPLRFSRILSLMLSKVSVPISDHDLIAGRCVIRLLSESEEERFKSFITDKDYPAHSFLYASGHCTYSWEELVSEGIVGLRAKAAAARDRAVGEEKTVFLTAMTEVYDAIIAFMLRYEKAARDAGLSTVADNLHKAATSRPNTFASALQLLWIITLIDCAYISENPTLTVGRLDQILYPIYESDIKRGTLTREMAGEYITDYYCKHNLIMGRGEHQVGDATNSTTFKRVLNFDAPQYLLLAGTDAEGKLAANDLTQLFAERIVPAFKNPVVVVRYVKDMNAAEPRLWRTLCDRALESASLMFYNDSNVISALTRLGVDMQDARQYAHFGCNWCSPCDNSAWMMNPPRSKNYKTYRTEEERRILDIPFMRTRSAHSWPEDVVEILKSFAERDSADVTIDDFYSEFFKRMAEFIDRKLYVSSLELSVRQRNPASVITFGDCFITSSRENAECFSAGAKYHFELQAFQMFGTVVDSFIAIDQLVMIEKKLTLRRLWDAVAADFSGYEDVLALCRNAEKYGMDTPLSNMHTARMAKTASDLVIEKSRPYFEKQRLFLVPCMQSDTWHIKYSRDFGATPDGRLRGAPFSQNSAPSSGACTNGITGLFNSMLNLPQNGLVSGALNLDVDPAQFSGDGGKEVFAALLACYFNQGGLHAQVSAASVEDLIDAKINPHLHRDLRVRVTGYSGIFVDFCETLQDDVINRFKNL